MKKTITLLCALFSISAFAQTSQSFFVPDRTNYENVYFGESSNANSPSSNGTQVEAADEVSYEADATISLDDVTLVTATAKVAMKYGIGKVYETIESGSTYKTAEEAYKDGEAYLYYPAMQKLGNEVSFTDFSGTTHAPIQGLEMSSDLSAGATTEVFTVTATADLTLYLYVSFANNSYNSNRAATIWYTRGDEEPASEGATATVSSRTDIWSVGTTGISMNANETITISVKNTDSNAGRLWLFGLEAVTTADFSSNDATFTYDFTSTMEGFGQNGSIIDAIGIISSTADANDAIVYFASDVPAALTDETNSDGVLTLYGSQNGKEKGPRWISNDAAVDAEGNSTTLTALATDTNTQSKTGDVGTVWYDYLTVTVPEDYIGAYISISATYYANGSGKDRYLAISNYLEGSESTITENIDNYLASSASNDKNDNATTAYYGTSPLTGNEVYYLIFSANIGIYNIEVSFTAEAAKVSTGDDNEDENVNDGDSDGENTAISSISSDNIVEVARYNILGQKIETAQKGINIVKFSDGSTQKVLVK